MKRNGFWSVELCDRMGPLVLGAEYEPLLEILRDHRVDVDRLRLDGFGKVAIPEIGIELIFSQASPRTLIRIDVSDERLRFGSLVVIGKRAHEIVGLFKIRRKGTLWSSIEPEGETSAHVATGNTNEQSRQLLARGTIWITALGLGLTLRDGLVSTVHLCSPDQSPRSGSGTWTKEQQLLSEVRELPAASLAPTRKNYKSLFNLPIHLALLMSIGFLIWWAMALQKRWDTAIEVSALVVGLDPPPPKVLPDHVTVSYHDSNGNEYRPTLGYRQFATTPKLGGEVNVRYLPDSPDKVLGPVASRDVGFETAFPYGIGILAVYSILQLSVLEMATFRRQRKRS